jgi:hypothetical protein
MNVELKIIELINKHGDDPLAWAKGQKTPSYSPNEIDEILNWWGVDTKELRENQHDMQAIGLLAIYSGASCPVIATLEDKEAAAFKKIANTRNTIELIRRAKSEIRELAGPHSKWPLSKAVVETTDNLSFDGRCTHVDRYWDKWFSKLEVKSNLGHVDMLCSLAHEYAHFKQKVSNNPIYPQVEKGWEAAHSGKAIDGVRLYLYARNPLERDARRYTRDISIALGITMSQRKQNNYNILDRM